MTSCGVFAVPTPTLVSLVLIALLPTAVVSLNNGVAQLPPMGWSTWNTFACNVSEALVMEAAQALVSSGMRDAGYTYLNIDDCWMKCNNISADGQSCYSPEDGRDPNTGQFVPDPVRFPHGMKYLADYVHSLGLKFGIYSSSGQRTCSGFMGSWENEAIDAKTFAEWGVDFLKLDCCNSTKAMKDLAYPRMSLALQRTKAPIVFSCDTDELFANPVLAYQTDERPFDWGSAFCNMWRTGPDIKDTWLHTVLNGNLNTNWWDNTNLAPIAGPGRWNDPDMMTVGMGAQSLVQYQSQMSLWAIQAAPLLAGNDVRNMSQEVVAILTNAEVIAVDQDQLATSGHRTQTGLSSVWVKPLFDGSVAAVLLNTAPWTSSISVTWQELGLEPGTMATVRDLWLHQTVGTFNNTFQASSIPAYGSVMIRAIPL